MIFLAIYFMEFTSRNLMKKVKKIRMRERYNKQRQKKETKKETSYKNETYKLCWKLIKMHKECYYFKRPLVNTFVMFSFCVFLYVLMKFTLK